MVGHRITCSLLKQESPILRSMTVILTLEPYWALTSQKQERLVEELTRPGEWGEVRAGNRQVGHNKSDYND